MDRSPIRICIVCHSLRAGGGISVGKNFVASITRALPNAEYQIFIPANLGYETSVESNIAIDWQRYESKYGYIGRWIYDKFILTEQLNGFSPSIVICLGNLGVKTSVAPQVILLQDAHYCYPSRHYARESLSKKLVWLYKRRRFSRDLKRVSVLLCQTTTVMNRVREWYQFNGDIALFPNAVSVDSSSGDYADCDAKTPPNDEVFRLFYLSRYYPHKNFEIFIDLFKKYRKQLDCVVLYLTISDDQHPCAKSFLISVRENGLADKIVNIGPIAQSHIAGTFGEMNALVMPSMLESFSGTYLEAMAYGCPILTSDLDFAHEVCGDAALYFNPWSVDDIYQAIIRVKEDSELAETLRSKGRQRVRDTLPSWTNNANTLREITMRLLDRSSVVEKVSR